MKLASSPALISLIIVKSSSFPEYLNPRIRKKMIEMMYEGPVVKIMCLICSNNVEPAMAGARFVVSESGDILSPKYAPEIMAPPIIGAGMPRPIPTPIKAIPTVPAVVQEDPVASDTIELINNVATRKMDGDKILRP